MKTFIDLMNERPQIKADSQGYNYKYADSAAVDDAIRPLLAKHNLTIMFEMKNKTLIGKLIDSEGQMINEAQIPFDDSLFANPQQLGSAITYYRRYAKLILLDLVIEGDDDDGARASQSYSKNIELLEDPGEYTLKFTKNKGKKLKELSHPQLEWYAKEFKHPETVAHAQAHLEQRKVTQAFEEDR